MKKTKLDAGRGEWRVSEGRFNVQGCEQKAQPSHLEGSRVERQRGREGYVEQNRFLRRQTAAEWRNEARFEIFVPPSILCVCVCRSVLCASLPRVMLKLHDTARKLRNSLFRVIIFLKLCYGTTWKRFHVSLPWCLIPLRDQIYS